MMPERGRIGRHGWIAAGLLLGLPAVVLLAAAVLLPRIELGPFAAARATAALGREVTIGSLRVAPGLPLRVALRDLRVANVEGGSRPLMAELARLDAAMSPLPLLWGEVSLNEVSAAGFALWLERAPGRRANWRFAPRATAAGGVAPVLPGRLDIADVEIVFRTTGGAELHTRIDTARLLAAPRERPAYLEAAGSYNGVALRLEATLPGAAELRAGGPVPVALRATAAGTTLLFEGTATDPLGFDGLDGRLSFAASSPRAVLAMAGVAEGPELPVEFTAQARREGDLWRLAELAGMLDCATLAAPMLELREGGGGTPDAIAARVDLARIDLDRLLPGPRGDDAADPPLIVPARPDPLIRAEVTARAFAHQALGGTDAAVAIEVAPARVTLESRFVTAFGAQVEARGEMVPAGDGARLDAVLRLREAEIDALRQQLGLGPLPVAGRAALDAAIAAEGATLGAARQAARVSAVLAMSEGSIAREVIEMASTDLRALFRTPRGRTPLTCLLAAVDLRGARGEVAPLRIRAGTGTIAGLMTFDLERRRLDLVIGSERATTDVFALDIPVRVSGTFGDLDVAPAEWSRAGRARLARGGMAAMPPELVEIARASACYRPGGVRR